MADRLGTIMAIAPAAIPVVWLLAGQWQAASPDQRAWFQLTTALCLSLLVSLLAVRRSSYRFASIMRLWAWSTVAGLLMMS